MPENFPFTVVRRRVRYARLEFTPRGLKIVAPLSPGFKIDEFLERHKAWLKRKMAVYAKMADGSSYTLVQRPAADFKRLIQESVALASATYNTKPHSITYRTMKNRWGSCSARGELKFNNNLRFLPDELVRYIAFHEVCHLKVPSHNANFKKLLRRSFPEYKQLDSDLLGYWHQLNK